MAPSDAAAEQGSVGEPERQLTPRSKDQANSGGQAQLEPPQISRRLQGGQDGKREPDHAESTPDGNALEDLVDVSGMGDFVLEHACPAHGKCVAVLERASGLIRCYHPAPGSAPLETWLPFGVCFSDYWDQEVGGACSTCGCAEDRPHIHAHRFEKNLKKGAPPQRQESIVLLQCEACQESTDDDSAEGCPQGQQSARRGAAPWRRHILERVRGLKGSKRPKKFYFGEEADFALLSAPNDDSSGLWSSFVGLGRRKPVLRPPPPRQADALPSADVYAGLEKGLAKDRGRGAAETCTTVMVVEGICCPSEVPIIDNILMELPGVEQVSTNVTAKTTTVKHNAQLAVPGDLVEALNAAGLEARLRTRGGAQGVRWPPPLLLLCGVLWVFSLCSEVSVPWHNPKRLFAVTAVVLGLPRIGRRAVGALRSGKLDINCLMILATSGALAIEEFAEAAAVIFLFGLSEWLESLASARARSALASVLELRPEEAVLASSGERVPAERVAVGDHIVVRAGERVPVDGAVLEGSSSLDESHLTGESTPVRKEPGSNVSAGTTNIGSSCLVVKTTALAKDSSAAQMVRLIEEANASRSKTELLVQKFATIYTPAIILLAASMASASWLFLDRADFLRNLYSTLVLLVVACPCALVISTPVAYVAAISCAATHNVIIRGGEYLEALARVRVVCFDKTGTLTEGRLGISRVLGPLLPNAAAVGCGGPDGLRRIMGLAGAVEQRSSHPLAAALVAYVKAQGMREELASAKVEGFKEQAGEGVEAMVQGHRVQVGGSRLAQRMCWLKEDGSPAAAGLAELAAQEVANQAVCFVGIDGELAAAFTIADAARRGAAECVAAVGGLGVEAVMLTGDQRAPAEAVARQLGVQKVLSELLPEGKVAAVQQLRECARSGGGGLRAAAGQRCCRSGAGAAVAMIGDGINDAAALATADIGFAMGAAGTQVALESAHVVLMDSDLRKVALSVRLGRLTTAKIRQNIFFALVSKLIMVSLTLAGFTALWCAILVDLGSMLAVTLNASLVLNLRRGARRQASGPGPGDACRQPCCSPGAGARAGGDGCPDGCRDCPAGECKAPGRAGGEEPQDAAWGEDLCLECPVPVPPAEDDGFRSMAAASRRRQHQRQNKFGLSLSRCASGCDCGAATGKGGHDREGYKASGEPDIPSLSSAVHRDSDGGGVADPELGRAGGGGAAPHGQEEPLDAAQGELLCWECPVPVLAEEDGGVPGPHPDGSRRVLAATSRRRQHQRHTKFGLSLKGCADGCDCTPGTHGQGGGQTLAGLAAP